MLLSAALAETTISAKCYKTMFTNNATEDTIKTTLLILRCTYNVISTTAPYFSEITHTKKSIKLTGGAASDSDLKQKITSTITDQ